MPERKIDTTQNKVYVRALDTYEYNRVSAVLFPLLDALLADNAIEKSTLCGKKVVLKPNLVAKREAETGITTHPAFTAPVLPILRNAAHRSRLPTVPAAYIPFRLLMAFIIPPVCAKPPMKAVRRSIPTSRIKESICRNIPKTPFISSLRLLMRILSSISAA